MVNIHCGALRLSCTVMYFFKFHNSNGRSEPLNVLSIIKYCEKPKYTWTSLPAGDPPSQILSAMTSIQVPYIAPQLERRVSEVEIYIVQLHDRNETHLMADQSRCAISIFAGEPRLQSLQ